MPDLHKTLILTRVVRKYNVTTSSTRSKNNGRKRGDGGDIASKLDNPEIDSVINGSHMDQLRSRDDSLWEVQELAIATEHAPFRHKKTTVEVGGQRKRTRR